MRVRALNISEWNRREKRVKRYSFVHSTNIDEAPTVRRLRAQERHTSCSHTVSCANPEFNRKVRFSLPRL